ncbi:MAG: hypothetical protein ACK4VN_14480 [Bacteroidales bacterium]
MAQKLFILLILFSFWGATFDSFATPQTYPAYAAGIGEFSAEEEPLKGEEDPDEQDQSLSEQNSFWKEFFLPGINVFHIIFLALVLALYWRNRSLWKQLMRTRGKLRNLHIKFNRRVDQLTYEHRENSKKANQATQ